eukprot:6359323-Pyramimonas_sp.AAC.1
MQVRWKDGAISILSTLTVGAWQALGRGESAVARSATNTLAVFEGAVGTVKVENKRLNPGEEGVVLKINGGQKLQLSLNKHSHENAKTWLIERAPKMADGSLTVEEAKAEKKIFDAKAEKK